MYRPAIVAIAYDRPEALKRLLDSIEAAVYDDGVLPTLVISIDNSGSDDVVNVAREFEYTHGTKVIIERPERMGLRAHVLSCGDLTDEYGSIIVLEDDLFVSPYFYGYACAALDLSENDDRIGAVSLYDHRFNVHRRESFCAIDDGYDNYYLQLASSWGQAYTKKQWSAFRQWYEANKDRSLSDPFVPANVSGWSDRSWLKYYIVYLIETDRFCLYPRISLTTNFGDVGSHAKKADTDLQVALSGGEGGRRPNFSTPDTSCAVYDAFFEAAASCDGDSISPGRLTPSNGSLIVDLYGIKPVKDMIRKAQNDPNRCDITYVLSSSPLPYKVIKSYGRQMRPVDANIRYNIKGNDFYLYDTTESAPPPAEGNKGLRLLYEYRGISLARMIQIIKYRILERFGGN